MEIGQFKAFEKLPELRPKLAKLFNDYFVGLNLNADEYEIIIDANTKLLSGAELYLNSWFHRNIFYEKKVVDKLLRNKCIDIQNMIDLFDTICEYFTDLNELLCEKKELGGRTLIY